jgi:hypothetical protein
MQPDDRGAGSFFDRSDNFGGQRSAETDRGAGLRYRLEKGSTINTISKRGRDGQAHVVTHSQASRQSQDVNQELKVSHDVTSVLARSECVCQPK